MVSDLNLLLAYLRFCGEWSMALFVGLLAYLRFCGEWSMALFVGLLAYLRFCGEWSMALFVVQVQFQVQVQFIWFHLITFYNKNR